MVVSPCGNSALFSRMFLLDNSERVESSVSQWDDFLSDNDQYAGEMNS
jgi:hypothetical protein